MLAVTVLALVGGLALPVAAGAVETVGETLLGFEKPYVREGRSVTHSGVDIRTDAGAAVSCLTRGSVVFSGSIPAGPGQSTNAVTIEDDEGGRWSYLPLEAVSVSEGTRMAVGEMIGVLSAEGDASSAEPHLHLGYRRAGEYQDPLSALGAASTGEQVLEPAEELPVADTAHNVAAAAPVGSAAAERLPSAATDAPMTLAPDRAPAGREHAQRAVAVNACVLEPAASVSSRATEIRDRSSVPLARTHVVTSEPLAGEPPPRFPSVVVTAVLAMGGVAIASAFRRRNSALNEVCADTRSTRLQPR